MVFGGTSASLRAELPPVPASVFAPGCLAYEMAYGKGPAPFAVAKAAGVTIWTALAWWRNRRRKPLPVASLRPDTRDVILKLTVPLV